MQQMRLLLRLFDNDAAIFIVVVVGPFHQDGGRGEEGTTPANAPAAADGGGDTEEIKEFCHRHPDCNVYVNRAVHDGLTDAQGQCQGVSPEDDEDDDDGDNNNDNWGCCQDA